jgi:ribosomal protein S18 acetylase RimI-like enzyme
MNDKNNKIDAQNPPFRGLGGSQAPTLGGWGVFVASSSDLTEILEIQKKAFLSESELYQNFNIQPLTQTIEEMQEECKEKIVLKAVVDGEIVGSIRANAHENGCCVNKLVVLPEFQKHGIGEKLLRKIENHFPEAKKFTLATGAKSESNIRLYQKVGYQIVSTISFDGGIEAVIMEKTNDIRKP